MLERAFPLEHRPTRIIIGRHLREDRTEIDLPVAERTEASGPIDPALIPAIDAGPAVGPEFGILDVKAAYPLVIDVEEREIIELLEHEVARREQQPCPRVPVHNLPKMVKSVWRGRVYPYG